MLRKSVHPSVRVNRGGASKMRRGRSRHCLALFFLFICSSTALSQDPSYGQKLYYTCKIWGFVKYYHARVSNCLVPWDDALARTLPLVKSAATAEEFNDALATLIAAAGHMPEATTPSPDTLAPELTRNRDFSWFDDPLLHENIRSKLRYIRDNFRPHIVCSVRKKNDTTLATSSYLVYPGDDPCVDIDASISLPDEYTRCLMLFKYWNIVNYFDLNLHLSDVPWDSTLIRHAASVSRANTYPDLYLEFKRITAALNDGHVMLLGAPYHPGSYQPKLILRFIGDGCYVFKSGYKEIHRGDKILSVEGKTIAQWEDSLKSLVSAGNPDNRKCLLCFFMLRGHLGTAMQLEYEDSLGAVHPLTVGRYANAQSAWFKEYAPSDSLGSLKWRKWECDVGYVNMGNLQPEDVASMYDSLKDAKAIIFDVRNYPNGTMWELVNRMYPKRQCLAIFSKPDENYPGVCSLEYSFSDSDHVAHPYKGKTIILCNQETQSHAEYTCMALQALPGAVVVGSRTAGADGNISQVNLSRDLTTFFTTLGVYYPDGRQTQRIGIVPDSVVHPTPEGIRQGRDEVLEKALEIAGCRSIVGAPAVPAAPAGNRLLFSGFPNPFSEATTLSFPESVERPFTFKVFDVCGREVLDLTDRIEGRTSFTLQHRQLPSPGMYFFTLQSGGQTRTSALLLLR